MHVPSILFLGKLSKAFTASVVRLIFGRYLVSTKIFLDFQKKAIICFDGHRCHKVSNCQRFAPKMFGNNDKVSLEINVTNEQYSLSLVSSSYNSNFRGRKVKKGNIYETFQLASQKLSNQGSILFVCLCISYIQPYAFGQFPFLLAEYKLSFFSPSCSFLLSFLILFSILLRCHCHRQLCAFLKFYPLDLETQIKRPKWKGVLF